MATCQTNYVENKTKIPKFTFAVEQAVLRGHSAGKIFLARAGGHDANRKIYLSDAPIKLTVW